MCSLKKYSFVRERVKKKRKKKKECLTVAREYDPFALSFCVVVSFSLRSNRVQI